MRALMISFLLLQAGFAHADTAGDLAAIRQAVSDLDAELGDVISRPGSRREGRLVALEALLVDVCVEHGICADDVRRMAGVPEGITTERTSAAEVTVREIRSAIAQILTVRAV